MTRLFRLPMFEFYNYANCAKYDCYSQQYIVQILRELKKLDDSNYNQCNVHADRKKSVTKFHEKASLSLIILVKDIYSKIHNKNKKVYKTNLLDKWFLYICY